MLVAEEPAVHTLQQVIGVVARGPDPEHVLPAVVDLLVDATAADACFIYLCEGPELALQAASRAGAHAVGRVALGAEEGIAGWVATHRTPAFLRDGALSDPRAKAVPELDEARFRSLAAVPLLAPDGGAVLGVAVLHTVTPLAFDHDVLDVLVPLAALVAGAVDTAVRFARARAEIAALSALADVTRAIATATRREDLHRVACAGVRRMLGADAAIRRTAPRAGAGEHALAAVLTSGDADAGMLVAERRRPFSEEEARLLDAVGDQLASALHKADLIERLTEEHLVRDLFDALAEGRPDVVESRARAAGHDLDQPHVVAVLEPLDEVDAGWPEVAARVEARLRRAVPGSLCDPGDDRVRALLPLGGGDAVAALAHLDAELQHLAADEHLAGGRGEPRRGLSGDQRGLAEATSAARVARAVAPTGGSRGYGDLGVYRYLAQLPAGHAPDERHAAAIATLAAYDAKRRTELLATLERHLGDRGALAATARALYIHTNTLRQRLDRIEALTGLDLATEDLLSLELALKLARLRPAATESQ
jgi:sugar diacid utilization regulator